MRACVRAYERATATLASLGRAAFCVRSVRLKVFALATRESNETMQCINKRRVRARVHIHWQPHCAIVAPVLDGGGWWLWWRGDLAVQCSDFFLVCGFV